MPAVALREYRPARRDDLGLAGLGAAEQLARRPGEGRAAGEALPAGAKHDALANLGREVGELGEGEFGGHGRGMGENTRVPLQKIAWLTVVGICLVAVVLLALGGYQGYAGVAFAVMLAAAINLR